MYKKNTNLQIPKNHSYFKQIEIENGAIIPNCTKIELALQNTLLYLKMITEFNKYDSQNLKTEKLKKQKEKFIKDVLFLKRNKDIIEVETNISYAEYLSMNLGEFFNSLNDQLRAFDLCAEQQNPDLFLQLDNNSALIEISKYDERNLRYNAFKEIEDRLNNMRKE